MCVCVFNENTMFSLVSLFNHETKQKVEKLWEVGPSWFGMFVFFCGRRGWLSRPQKKGLPSLCRVLGWVPVCLPFVLSCRVLSCLAVSCSSRDECAKAVKWSY